MTSLWRKQVLPLATIPWRGRELAFTPAYLADMAAAFAAGALDVVPFAFPGDRDYSNDPALIRGEVRSLEVVADGMDAIIAVDAEMGAFLAELLRAGGAAPDTGARIIERYQTTDGREFPVVLAGVYTTDAPVLTGLRPWKREPGGEA